MSSSDRYSFPSGVAFQRLGEDQDGVMMSLASGFLYRCNRTACVVLEAISNGHSLDEAGEELCRQFGVDAERARRDVEALIENLRQRRLVSVAA
jgi:Coenzyme PQQ synthesis protein D (PqqD)